MLVLMLHNDGLHARSGEGFLAHLLRGFNSILTPLFAKKSLHSFSERTGGKKVGSVEEGGNTRTKMRRTVGLRWGQAPAVYPFPKPFHSTPYDEDKHRLYVNNMPRATFPDWMRSGMDGTGHGIGLHRNHPLSPLVGNLRRGKTEVPRIFKTMIQGVHHKSGVKLYYRGGKVPRPNMHPYLTGEPCPVYGWRVTDHNVTRQFDAPVVEPDKARYKAYVALQEKRLMAKAPQPGKPVALAASSQDKPKDESKPLLKRLFFWR